MDYQKVLNECATRIAVYRMQDAIWNLTHEEECFNAISGLLKQVEALEAENRSREESSIREHAETHYWRDLARAAQAHLHELETTHRTEMCSDGYDCVELGEARKAAMEAENRAMAAEKERDEAITDMKIFIHLFKKIVSSSEIPESLYLKWQSQMEK